jgi:hypothetical protein
MTANKPPTRPAPTKSTKSKLRVQTLARLAGHAGHTMMGAALGLAFAFVATRSPVFGVTPLLAKMSAPGFRLADFAVTCALAFGIVTTITGLAIGIGEDR